MTELAERLKYFDSSDFREVFIKQQNIEDAIDLSVGIPEELTPDPVKSAGIDAIRLNKTTYAPANGYPELRQAIAHKLNIDNNITANENTVTLVPGLTTGLLLVYLAILNPGDEIIIMDPYYPPYPSLARMVGAEVLNIPTKHNFQPDIELIKDSITTKTKAIIINSPNNPTGSVYSKKTLEEIANIADQNNLLVISDEIYEDFVYNGKQHFSIGSIYPNTITMNGFSKGHSMTGWRLGYLVGPNKYIEAINAIQQYTVFSSSSIAQHAAIKALKHKPNHNNKYQHKRDLAVERLNDMGYEVNGADGAYYLYLKTPNNSVDLDFMHIATDHKLILLPGRAFSSRHGYFRLSYGNTIEVLERGLNCLESITKLTA